MNKSECIKTLQELHEEECQNMEAHSTTTARRIQALSYAIERLKELPAIRRGKGEHEEYSIRNKHNR